MAQTDPQTGAPSGALRAAVLISGSGSTLANLIHRIADGRLRGLRVVLVISSRAEVRGVEIARVAGLPVRVIRPRDFADVEHYSEAIAAALDDAQVQLALMGGFLTLWHIPPRYAGRVLNIHPSLLPAFGGKGMHGMAVHRAVLAAGATESGCTVHLADNEYDHGPIVAQARVPVLAGDSPEALAERVAAAERWLYPAVVQHVADQGLAELVSRSGQP